MLGNVGPTCQKKLVAIGELLWHMKGRGQRVCRENKRDSTLPAAGDPPTSWSGKAASMAIGTKNVASWIMSFLPRCPVRQARSDQRQPVSFYRSVPGRTTREEWARQPLSGRSLDESTIVTSTEPKRMCRINLRTPATAQGRGAAIQCVPTRTGDQSATQQPLLQLLAAQFQGRAQFLGQLAAGLGHVRAGRRPCRPQRRRRAECIPRCPIRGPPGRG